MDNLWLIYGKSMVNLWLMANSYPITMVFVGDIS